MKRIIARHLRVMLCDPDKNFQQLRQDLNASQRQLLSFAEERLIRDRKNGNSLSSQVDLLAQDCLQVRRCGQRPCPLCFCPVLESQILCVVLNAVQARIHAQ
ncbi:MAG: hypothetical protein HC767_00100 [Akkermansiaceae bacterium]|nr:hypothetical protein [Akkermansiaceae bacterium]